MQSRIQSEVARLEQQLNVAPEIKELWTALKTKADLDSSDPTANKTSNAEKGNTLQELRRIDVSF